MMLDYITYGNINNPKQLVILLHGYGSNKNDLITLAPELAQYLPDALFISPNAPEDLEGELYYNMDAHQWFSLSERTEQKMYQGANKASLILEAFIKQQLEKFQLSFSNIALVGFSQGAMMALHTGLRLSERVRGIVGYSGLLIAPDKLKSEIKSKPSVMLVHGVEDNVVPIEEMEQAYKALDDNEVISYKYKCNRLAHGIDAYGIRIGGSFLSEIFNK